MAHGYAAYRLGDPTARYAHRLTLNPLAHIDLIGSVLLPLILIITKSPILLGWAKPVPFNPRYFRNLKRGVMIVGLAGPASNLILAAIAGTIIRIIPFGGIIRLFLLRTCIINVVLAIFNLIPIPPLDGSRVAIGFLPPHLVSSCLLASGHKQKFVFILSAAVLGLIFLSSLRSLKLITRDLSAGAAEEILGSVQKREGSVLDGIPSLINLVPAISLAADLARTILRPVALSGGKFTYAVTAGFPLVLVKPHSTEIICVDRDTYQSFPDGTLAKAVVLPLSRLALIVTRASVGDI